MAWTALAILGGSALGLMGANKQAKAIENTNQANLQAQKESDRENWDRYLLTRGIDAKKGNAAVNSRLPLWANVNVVRPSSTSFRLVPKGTAPVQTRITGMTRTPTTGGSAAVGGGSSGGGGGGGSTGGGGAYSAADRSLDYQPPGMDYSYYNTVNNPVMYTPETYNWADAGDPNAGLEPWQLVVKQR